MIIFLTLCYVALLAVLVKLKVVKLTAFWKLSPLLWMLLLLILLFIPMQWGAPMGSVTKYQYVVEIVPNVSGQVIEVSATAGQRMNKGDVLFKIDPTTFEAAVGNLKAALELAETRLAQSKELVKRQAGSVYDVEQYEAQVKQYKEQLRSAEWNLNETVVRAPADGHVIGLTLQPGQRVSNLPLRAWISYVVEEDKLVVGINQNQIRHVRPGMPAEVTLKQFPGNTLAAKVDFIAPMTGQGQLPPSGVVPTPVAQAPGPFGVILELADDRISMDQILGGAAGSAAIYTNRLKATHIIRRVILRTEAWANYVNPF